MKNNKIFDLWLSEYSLEEISQMSNMSIEEIKKELKQHVLTLDIEEEEKYFNVWTTYQFTKQQFVDIFKESALIYNFLELMHPKGDKHPIYLLFDHKYNLMMQNYLNTTTLLNINEDANVDVEIKTAYEQKEALTEQQLLKLGFLAPDKYLNFFTNYVLTEELFCMIFKLNQNDYAYLQNRFMKGSKDFSEFIKLDPTNEYSLRFKLQKNINKLNAKNKLITANKLRNSELNASINELEHKLFKLLDKNKKQTQKIKMEIFEPDFSHVFTNFESTWNSNSNFEEDVPKTNHKKISHTSLCKLKLAHETKTQKQIKLNYINTINDYQKLNQNVKSRFDVKKEVK